MKTFLAKKGVAIAFLCVCVIFSALFSAKRSLSALKTGVDAYFLGESESIMADVQARASAAVNLTVVAARYMSENDPAIGAVVDARSAVSHAQTPPVLFRADNELSVSVDNLAKKLSGLQLTERDAAFARGLPAEMESYADYIRRNPYNDEARIYNDILDGFPAGLLAAATGVERAEYYE